jgi:soluble lytic murein transglycosylase-like protein
MRATIAVLCTLITAAPAAADIYTFVDEQGVTYFSNVPTDNRYETILREVAEQEGVEVHPIFLKRAAEFEPFILEAAAASAVDPALLRAIIVVESGFDANALSSAGAQGLMQLMPQTAAVYGVSDAFDPGENIRAGASYLRDLIDRYGNDFELALAAYNAGEDAVAKYGNQVPPYAETRAYIPKVLGVYKRLQELSAQT